MSSGVRVRAVIVLTALAVIVAGLVAWLIAGGPSTPPVGSGGTASGPPLTAVIGGVPADQVPGLDSCSAIEQTTVITPQSSAAAATPLPTPRSLDVRGGAVGSGQSPVNPFTGGCAPASPRPAAAPPSPGGSSPGASLP